MQREVTVVSTVTDGQRIEVYPGKEAIVTFDPDRTFTCVDSCTWCCHHGVLLYEPDFFRLAEYASLEQVTTEVRGRPFIRREEKDRTEHVDIDGAACSFLDADGKCSLHATHDWKPTRCSVFPLEVTRESDALIVGIREDAERNCEGLDETDRRLIDHLDAFLPPELWDIDMPDTHVTL